VHLSFCVASVWQKKHPETMTVRRCKESSYIGATIDACQMNIQICLSHL